MARDFFTIDDYDVRGKTVLVRVDINVPLDPATHRILNDARIREHLGTIRDLSEAKVAVLAHQSRPGKDDFTNLEAHAERLSALLGKPVRHIDSLYGRHAIEAIRALLPGDVILLENTRFYSEEEALADAPFEKQAQTHIVEKLAPHADLFVLDAFAAAHRAQPSLVGFCEVLPTVAGRVMETELTMLNEAMHSEDRPKLAVFGGVKADDSVSVTDHMLSSGMADRVLTAGGVASLFLAATGVALGPRTEGFLRRELKGYDGLVAGCREILARFPGRVGMPVDVAVNDGGRRKEIPVSALPSDQQIVDIGLETIATYAAEVGRARTIVLNGPPGVFELDEFSVGTRELFRAIAGARAFKVAGGGHTVAAIEELGLARSFNHVSTGGGALIHLLAGKELPLVTALRRSFAKFAPRPPPKIA